MQIPSRLQSFGVLLLGVVLAGSACNTQAQEVVASDEEKAALLEVCATQAQAVVTFNEALMTAQAARRARAYLERWRGRSGSAPQLFPADLAALETGLQILQDRFFCLYQAHFGPTKDRNGTVVPLSPEAQRLAENAQARADEREQFIADCRAARTAAEQILKSYRSSLASLAWSLASVQNIPQHTATPRFMDKPSATLRPDGTATGIIFGCPLGHPTRPPPAATAFLDIDFEAGIYEAYVNGWQVPPLQGAAERGRQTQIIVPCACHQWMYCPVDWYLAHRPEGLTRPGAPEEYKGQWLWALDFYHPTVRQMFANYLKKVGERFRDNPNVLMYTTAWEPELNDTHQGEWGRWPTGGRTPAAVQAFRDYLRQKFGTISKLNDAWGSNYATFGSIEPPPDVWHGPEPQRSELVKALSTGACPPLYYEFNRFLKDSYADYLAWCYRLLKAADPNHPISLSPSYGLLDGYLCGGRDSFRWATDCCDIYGNESQSSLDEVFNWSIQRALNRPTGIFECIWNGPENWSNPPEEVVRAAARRNLWRMVAWGRTVLSLFGAQDTYGGSSYNNMLVFESGYHLLRRSAGIIGPLKRKLRSMEDVWLGAPVVEPQIAMLKPSVSQICAWPSGSHEDAVTRVTSNLHNLLYKRNYHYAFVPEEYVLSGQDRLERYRVLILPYATHFPPGLTEKIVPWVKAGGTLISAGIAGGFTPYGVKDGALMKEFFGDLSYQIWGDLYWKLNIAKLLPEVQDVGPTTAETFLTRHGQGQVLLAARANDLRPGGSAAGLFYQLLDQAAPRAAWVEGAEIEMVLRQDNKALHMILINPSSRETAEATIHLARFYTKAVDRGIEGGFPVPLRADNSGQAFDIWLAPGEGTVIDLR